MRKKEECLREMWDIIKHTNISTIRVPKGGRQEKGIGNIFKETMAENVPNLMKDMNINIQEAQQMPSRMNLKTSMPRHIISKSSAAKDIEF